MGGKSKSSSNSTQTTTTRDERIAATDFATVIKDSFSRSTIDLDITDGGAIQSNEKISLAVLEGAGKALDESFSLVQNSADKFLEYISNKTEDSNSSTATKVIPWLVAGASIFALSAALRK